MGVRPSEVPPMTQSRQFGAHSTASEVVAGLDLSNVAAIVTGASGGLGAETARR